MHWLKPAANPLTVGDFLAHRWFSGQTKKLQPSVLEAPGFSQAKFLRRSRTH